MPFRSVPQSHIIVRMGGSGLAFQGGASMRSSPQGWMWGAGLMALAALAASGTVAAAELNDYPTEARADYVFACMKTNGDTQVALRQCSCSIDVIASILPYDHYVEAQTVLSLAQVPGRFGAMFRSPEPSKQAVNNLRRAQAEAEVRCF
jgi:hypothetical protein